MALLIGQQTEIAGINFCFFLGGGGSLSATEGKILFTALQMKQNNRTVNSCPRCAVV